MVVFELRIAGESMASRDFAFLQVYESALVASIAGGTEVARSIKAPIVLDGSLSFDPENEVKPHEMVFLWSFLHPKDDKNMSDKLNSNNTSFMAPNASSQNVSNILDSFISLVGDISVQLQNGVLKHHATHGKVILDTTQLISNTTYYIMLTIESDQRIAQTVQTLHLRDEELLDIGIR